MLCSWRRFPLSLPLNCTKLACHFNQSAMANLTAQTRLTGRAFGRWWWRDLRKAWLSLTAATILIELAGLALLAGAVLIIPNLQAGLSSGSLSSLVRLFIAVGGHLYETGGLVLLAAVLIISWLGLSAAIL